MRQMFCQFIGCNDFDGYKNVYTDIITVFLFMYLNSTQIEFVYILIWEESCLKY